MVYRCGDGMEMMSRKTRSSLMPRPPGADTSPDHHRQSKTAFQDLCQETQDAESLRTTRLPNGSEARPKDRSRRPKTEPELHQDPEPRNPKIVEPPCVTPFFEAPIFYNI